MTGIIYDFCHTLRNKSNVCFVLNIVLMNPKRISKSKNLQSIIIKKRNNVLRKKLIKNHRNHLIFKFQVHGEGRARE